MAQDPEVVIVGADGTEHVFPAGTDPKRAAAIVRGQKPDQPQAVSRRPLPRPSQAFGGQREEIGSLGLRHMGKQDVIEGLDLLPIAGGGAGALLGTGWASVPLAALGGAGGEAFRQIGRRALGASAPASPMAAATDIATQGGIQGATQALGVGAGKVLPVAARRLYQAVAKPSKAVRNEFPTVVTDALEEGVPLGARGVEKAGEKVAQAGGEVRDAIASAQAAGAKPVNPRPVAASLSRTADKVAKQPLRIDDLKTVQSIRDQFLAENPGRLSLTAAQEMKQAAQRQASEGYRKIAAGGDINTVPLDARMDLARGLREAIERRVPGIAELNARTQRLMGVEKMATEAQGRIGNTLPTGLGIQGLVAGGVGSATGMATGDARTGAAAGLATLALTNPQLASRLAILMQRSGPLATEVPNAARLAALLAQLEGAEAPK